MRDEPNKESSNRSSIDRTKLESRSNDSNNYPRSPILSAEDRLRQRLVAGNENIRNINVSIEKFFKGWVEVESNKNTCYSIILIRFRTYFLSSSKLSKVAKKLGDDVLEIAAKAQLLWSVPGVALKPNMFCSLDFVKNFLCKWEGNSK